MFGMGRAKVKRIPRQARATSNHSKYHVKYYPKGKSKLVTRTFTTYGAWMKLRNANVGRVMQAWVD